MRTKVWLLTLILISFVLTSCTNHDSNSPVASGQTGTGPQAGTSTAVRTSQTYTVEPLVAGNGRITSFATYSNNLFWSDDYLGDGIWKYSVTDNTNPVLLVPRLHTPEIIVVRGNYFYWVDTLADAGIVGKKLLYKTTLDGSQTTLLREGNVLESTTNQILVDDTAVYWANGSGYYSPAQIERVPLDGSASQVIYTAADIISAISMDDNYIYWLDKTTLFPPPWISTLFRIAKTGGNVETVCEGLIEAGCTGMDASSNMVVDNNYVYLGLSQEIIKVPSAGGSTTVIAQSDQVCTMGMSMYDSNLYWLNYSNSALLAFGGARAILSAPTDSAGSFSVVAANLAASKGLQSSSDGLLWIEDDQDFGNKLKKLSWGAGSSDTLATGINFESFDIVGSNLYFTELSDSWHYSQIGKISMTTGAQETLFGGLNNESASLVPTKDYLFFGDGHALKKVPVNGGRTETLFIPTSYYMTFDSLYEKDGWLFFTYGGDYYGGDFGGNFFPGVYKISLNGGSVTPLVRDAGSSGIIKIQDGYIYYRCYPPGPSPVPGELHRVVIDGGTPEVVFKAQEGQELSALDGITTAYLTQCIWNDQYKILKHDIATGQETQVYSGNLGLIGINANAVFIDNNGFIYRIPKDGGTWDNILTVYYPLTIGRYWISAGAEDFYFIISYFDEMQGYFSEIALLKRLN